MIKRLAGIIILTAILVACFMGLRYYRWIYAPVTPAGGSESFLLVPSGTTRSTLVDGLIAEGYIRNRKAFDWVADRMQFEDSSVKSGRYLVEPGLSHRELINKLRLGQQEPLDLVIRPVLSLNRMAADIGRQLEVDSTSFVNYVWNDYLPQSEFDSSTILTLFIPNTYEVWWNTSTAGLVTRFEKEHDAFWNAERISQAKAVGLTSGEVYTLASIVERETHIEQERPVIAGVYLNRLSRNMLLQADPTVLFAVGDFSIRRVLYSHLEVDSPYNTYRYPGLPPGPIAMPSISSIRAVLNPASHDYLYFCAMPGGGGHAFAETLAGHNRNARAYRQWLNEQRIN